MDILKEHRREFRAWRNRRRLDRELAWYRREVVRRGLSLPDETAIRRSVAARCTRLGPKLKGGMVIAAVYHNYNWEEEALGPSLRKFGTVLSHDWWDRPGAAGPAPGDAARAARGERIVSFVRKCLDEGPVDVVFAYLSGEIVDPGAVGRLRDLGVPLVNLSLNDKEWFVGKRRDGAANGTRDICRHFDLCWTSTRDALEKYRVEGATPIYLPEGANPDVHRPYDVPREFDVSFVGQRYGNRPAVVEALRSAGIRVAAFGPGWPNGPLSTDEMVKTYSRSRVNLGFGGVAGHRETFCLKGRDFEVPMSGGLYLTEHHEELLPFFEIGKEIVTYDGFDDLVAKIRWLLSSPDEAEAIRRAGRERALREHTWEMRFEKVFRLTGILA